ncbi:MAG: leader peptidase (prepilin peptidase) / N-methyltransferase [Candidatus Eremiobacteraeota bacterium]|nr:leader peptidase (prepilin peptidase) / N-methyltransferase [Candidatus Eremiobacteraeota bacterium]
MNVVNALSVLPVLAGTLVAAVVDARTGYIPDSLTRATAFAALGLALVCGAAVHACAGAFAVGGTLLALHLLTRGRGLGLGDVKLGTAIGAGFGPSAGIIALGAAFVAGGAYASWLLATGRAQRNDAIPFGPFLAAGTLAALIVPAGLLP